MLIKYLNKNYLKYLTTNYFGKDVSYKNTISSAYPWFFPPNYDLTSNDEGSVFNCKIRKKKINHSFVFPSNGIFFDITLSIKELLKKEKIKVVLNKPIKFYQASSSDMFGDNYKNKCTEKTPFNPTSPYAISKLSAHQITINYRNNFAIHASTGILFNHESPLREDKFVTKKIISGLVKIKTKKNMTIKVGNIDARRDWGHAKDFVEAQWLMLQQEKPDDFVIATGKQHSVKEFINLASKNLDMKIEWRGKGKNEIGAFEGKDIIKVDPRYFRPTEVETLLGDASKAKEKLKWVPKISFDQLVNEMVEEDLKLAKNDQLVKK